MPKRLTSLRISDYTTEQVQQLTALYQASQAEVIAMAVARMYRQDIGGNLMEKAQPDEVTQETK